MIINIQMCVIVVVISVVLMSDELRYDNVRECLSKLNHSVSRNLCKYILSIIV